MSSSPLDRSILAELVELDPVDGLELVRDLVQIFFRESPDRLDRMRCGLSLGDGAQLSQAAHAIKGAAAGLGAVELAARAGQIERRARTGDLGGLAAEVDAVELALPGLQQALDLFLSELAGARDAAVRMSPPRSGRD
jgi:HPt (histidine-containing phosphotransfer) domain-containing protein